MPAAVGSVSVECDGGGGNGRGSPAAIAAERRAKNMRWAAYVIYSVLLGTALVFGLQHSGGTAAASGGGLPAFVLAEEST